MMKGLADALPRVQQTDTATHNKTLNVKGKKTWESSFTNSMSVVGSVHEREEEPDADVEWDGVSDSNLTVQTESLSKFT